MPHRKLILAILLTGIAAATTFGDNQVITLRILTYNIHNGTGMDNKRDLERTAAVIKAARPDLVALQEVDNKSGRSGNVDQAARLAELTGLHAVFGKSIPLAGGAYGNAILSRYPIQKTVVHPLPSETGSEKRSVLETRIPLGDTGAAIAFFNTHLHDRSTGDAERVSQVKTINAISAAQTNALQFLAGDFNDTPGSRAINEVLKHWRDAGPDEKQLTYPAGTPKVRIDYILHSPSSRIRVIEAKVLDEPLVSDHRPLLVTVEIRAN